MAETNKKDKLIKVTFPKYCGRIIAATIASTLSSFVDGCITGKMLGAEAMAAFGIAMPFILILLVVPGIILSSGGSICCSKFIGENNRDRANTNFTSCCMTAAIVGVVGTIVCLTCPELIMKITGATGNVASEAVAYMRGYSLGAIPTILLTVLMYYANLDGHENMSLIAVVIMTVVDIALDLFLGVYLGWGMLGMALATSISYIAAVVYFIVAFLRGKSSFSLHFRNQKTEFVDIIKNGYPSALNTLLVSARCFLLNTILISIAGQAAVTAFSFQSNFNQFFVAIASGISTTVSALTGIFIGEKDKRKIDSSVREGFKIGIILTVAFMLVLFFGAPLLTDLLMKGSPIEKQYSINALRLFSLSMPFSSICIVFIAYYQTLGNRKLANIIAVGHGLVFVILSALVLPTFMGLNGVWISTLVGELLMLLTLFIYSWIHTRRMPHKLGDMIIMDEKLLENEEDVYRDSSDISNTDKLLSMRNDINMYLGARHLSESVTQACTDAWDCLMGICRGVETGNAAEESGAETCGNAINGGVTSPSKKTITDVQSYMTGADNSVSLNIRFSGEEMYKDLNAGAGEELKKKLREKRMDCYYRYGAGISFVNVKQEEIENE